MTKIALPHTPNMTPDQQAVFDKIISLIDRRTTDFLQSDNIQDYMISLTGAAGTGKTFLTVQIIKHLIEKYPPKAYDDLSNHGFTVTAPTHKAVSVIANMLREQKIQASCKTIHSFLGIKPFIDYEKGTETFKVDQTKKTKEGTKILIVDESSMIGRDLFEYIQEAIEDGRVKVVLFIGDPYQLLPIDKGDNLIYKLPQSYTLNEVVRQAKDSYIIKIATQLRERIQSQNFIPLKELFYQYASKEIELFYDEKEFMKDFYKNEKWHKEDKVIATHKNKDVNAFNRHVRLKYWEQKGINSPQTLLCGDMLRFNTAYSAKGITLYNNGQIVQIENAKLNYHDSLGIYYWECKVYGPTFRVVDPTSLKTFNDKLSSIAKRAKRARYSERKKLWRGFFEVRDMFADVQYIYASTIHKLQGSTYDVSYVDLFSLSNSNYISNDEKYRLSYVAITRAKQDIKIFLPKMETSQNRESIDMEQNFNQVDALLKEIKI